MVNIRGEARYKINRTHTRDSLLQYLKVNRVDPSYIVNVIFVGKRKMKLIAAQYKKETEALPVLSFPYANSQGPKSAEESKILGEIFICYPQAILLAAHRSRPVDKIINELVQHGANNLLI